MPRKSLLLSQICARFRRDFSRFFLVFLMLLCRIFTQKELFSDRIESPKSRFQREFFTFKSLKCKKREQEFGLLTLVLSLFSVVFVKLNAPFQTLKTVKNALSLCRKIHSDKASATLSVFRAVAKIKTCALAELVAEVN